MKVSHPHANVTVIQFANGFEVMFSYNTPVAGFAPNVGWFKTQVYFSATTTKHINLYLGDKENVKEVDQGWINTLLPH